MWKSNGHRHALARRAMLSLAMLLCTGAADAEQRASTATAGVRVIQPRLKIPVLDRERTIRVYLPPGYDRGRKRYPVLYMHDGQNLFDDATSFVGEWGVDESMDKLARERGVEVIIVGIDHGDDKRINELSPWPNPKYGAAEGKQYAEFVVRTVKPYVDANFRTRRSAADTGIMGSSLGGLLSHYAILAYPETFGKAGIFSPSYWFSEQVYAYTREHRLPDGARVYLVAGSKESEETTSNLLRMDQLIRHAGNRRLSIHTAVLDGGEHNERFWRTEFPAAMIYLFGARRPSEPADGSR